MTDVAWTGLGVIFAGLFAAGATIFQAKFSAENAARIAFLESEVGHLKGDLEEMSICKAELDAVKDEVIRLKAEVSSLKQYTALLEGRLERNQPPG